jgi:hypothetical protein
MLLSSLLINILHGIVYSLHLQVFLGYVAIPLAQEKMSIQEQWFPMEIPKEKENSKSKSQLTGEIKITIQELLI